MISEFFHFQPILNRLLKQLYVVLSYIDIILVLLWISGRGSEVSKLTPLGKVPSQIPPVLGLTSNRLRQMGLIWFDDLNSDKIKFEVWKMAEDFRLRC